MRLVVPTSTSLAPALAHDVGNAERAADLDQLAARDDHFAPVRERVEHEQHGGGVVVDDGRGLGAGQFAQQALDDRSSRSPRAPESRSNSRFTGARQRAHDRAHGLIGQQRAAEVRVQHGAGQIEYRSQSRTVRHALKLRVQGGGNGFRFQTRARQRVARGAPGADSADGSRSAAVTCVRP